MPASKKITGDVEKARAEAARLGAGDAQAAAAKRDEAEILEAVSSVSGAVAGGDRKGVYQAYSEAYDRRTRREELVDAGSEMSFPASDPPSYMAGSGVAGSPDADLPTEGPNTRVSDPAEVKPAKDIAPQPPVSAHPTPGPGKTGR